MQDSALAEILAHYRKSDRSSLVPVLQDIQERLGYLPEEAMLEVARYLGVDEATVFSVATFYAQFKLVPVGKRLVKVCLGTACHVRGGPFIMDAAERELGVAPGGTTPDREFTLERVACFGSCALAPVVVVNRDVYGRMTQSRVKEVLREHKGTGKGNDDLP